MNTSPNRDWVVKHNHIWKKDEYGNIDEFALSEGYHNGVICVKCGDSFCVHCTSDYDEKICDTVHYECPTCNTESLKKTKFCSNCGIKMKY